MLLSVVKPDLPNDHKDKYGSIVMLDEGTDENYDVWLVICYILQPGHVGMYGNLVLSIDGTMLPNNNNKRRGGARWQWEQFSDFHSSAADSNPTLGSLLFNK